MSVITKDYTIDCYCLGQLSQRLGGVAILDYLDELVVNRTLLDDFQTAVKDVAFFRTKHWDSILELGLYRILCYVLTRAVRPDRFVETGVLHGMTSAFVLEAMAANGRGRLISVDLPSYYGSGPANQDGFDDTLPPDKEPGWIIPDRLHPYWQLHLGRSDQLLPDILDEGVDVFLHDSEHTVSTMTFEYQIAWEHLSDGGVLMSDNIDVNTAFESFCKRVDRKPLCFPQAINETSYQYPVRFGLIIK